MNERFARANAIAQVDLAHEPEFALGRIRIRPAHCELVGTGWSDTLEPRVMQVLVALARADGEVVSRDDLIEACWESRVVSEASVGRCIGRLRKAAEASGNTFTIETVSRVGYRLKTGEPVPTDPGAVANLSASAAAPRPKSWGAARSRVLTVGAVVALALLSAGSWWWWTRVQFAQTAPIPRAPAASVAVLPFANMSSDPSKEYFSDGFSEELLNDLANDSRLRVAARTSAFAFKNRNEAVQVIARALQVRAVVEGSVREADNRIRIAARLVDGSKGYTIWSATYDRDARDILQVQDEIARAIAVALTHRLAPAVPSVHRRIDPAVYREYLEAAQLYNQFTRESFDRATVLLEHVTTAQPDFASGFAEFARNRIRAADYDPAHTDAYLAAAREAVQKALTLDSRDIRALVQRGKLQLAANNFAGATTDFRTLVKRDPDDVRVLSGLRVYYNEMGFPNKAIDALESAHKRDPLSDGPALIMLEDLLKSDRYSEAISTARSLLTHLRNHDWVLGALCRAYAMTHRMKEARNFQQRLQALQPAAATAGNLRSCDFDIDLIAGDTVGARNILRAWETDYLDTSDNALRIAESYVELHDFGKASEWFERDYDDRDDFLFSDAYWIEGAEYRKTTRWKALTQRARFREWQAEHDRVAAELKSKGGHL